MQGTLRPRGLALTAVVLTALWSSSASIDNGDTGLRLRVAEQLLTEHRLVVHSYADSSETSRFRDQDGVYSSFYGIGQSIFLLPFAAAARPLSLMMPLPAPARTKLARLFIAVALFSVVLILNFRLCVADARLLGADTLSADLIGFGAVFGSSFWSMAKEGQEEVQLSILLLLGLYGFLRWRSTRRWAHVWLSAAAAGLALLFRPTAITFPLGFAALYGWESLRLRKKLDLQAGTVWRVIACFVLAGACGLAIVAWCNDFKTGHPLHTGYPTGHRGFYLQNWWRGLIGPTVGLDRGIIWHNPWLLPLSAVAVLRWRWLRPELRSAAALGVFLFLGSLAIYCTWITWAGDSTYGTRFQQHVIPLLGVVLGVAVLSAFPSTRRGRQLVVATVVALAVVQVPSLMFRHQLEVLQRTAEGASTRPGETVTAGRGGQLRLRYQNIAAKLLTGLPTVGLDLAPQSLQVGLLGLAHRR